MDWEGEILDANEDLLKGFRGERRHLWRGCRADYRGHPIEPGEDKPDSIASIGVASDVMLTMHVTGTSRAPVHKSSDMASTQKAFFELHG